MALLLRLNKAAPLTNAELDDNFLYLETFASSIQNSKLSTANLLTQIKLIDGAGTGIDADLLHAMTPTDQNQNSTIVSRNASGNFSANIITASLNGNAATASYASAFSGIVPIAQGGSGVSTLPSGHVSSNGTILSTSTTIPGTDIAGNISGTAGNVSGVVAIANGGTGATTSAGAAAALGIAVGQTVQAYSSKLQEISNLTQVGFVCTASPMQTRVLEVGNGLQITNPSGQTANPKIELLVVPIANGGTGASTASSAIANLGGAKIDSPNFIGVPTAPTAALGTKTTQIATTEFVINNRIPAGTVLNMAHLTAPSGYLLTDGATYSIATYPDLYAAVGTRFGTGGGSTFNVPTISAPAGLISVIKI